MFRAWGARSLLFLSARHYCLSKANFLEGSHGLPYRFPHGLPYRLPYMVYPVITLALSLKILTNPGGLPQFSGFRKRKVAFQDTPGNNVEEDDN